MKKIGSFIAIFVLCAGLVNMDSSGGQAVPFNNLPYVSTEMLDADYWIAKMENPDQVLMSLGEIKEYNRLTYEQESDEVYDLTAYADSLTKDQICGWMAFEPGKGPYYLPGEDNPVDQEFLDEAVHNMNMEGVASQPRLTYALAVRRCDLKALPIAPALSDEPGDWEYDDYQYTVLLPAEPAIILHSSLDGKWRFVQCYNCRGWVQSDNLAVCDEQVWKKYLQSKKQSFVCINANYIKLNQNPYSQNISELLLPMGSILPLAGKDEIPAVLDGQNPSGNWVVKLPVRTDSGRTEFKMAMIPYSADACEGFLPYTSANVVKQAFKTLGDRYGWGGMLGGRDCSSLVMNVYACFGFTLPRNTSGQSALQVGKALELDVYSQTYRNERLNELRPGAALYFPGHTMFYLGQDGGRQYVISSLGSYATFDAEGNMSLQRVHGTVVNDLSLTRRNGHTWLEELTIAQQYYRTRFVDLEGNENRARIETLADKYIVTGTEDDIFDPDSPVTRGDMAIWLMKIRQLEPDPAAATFPDVQGLPCQGAVGAMVKAGLMSGADNGEFMPGAPLNRAQMAVLVTRCLQLDGADNSLPIDFIPSKDFDQVPDWAKKAVGNVVAAGIIVPGQDGCFHPEAACTRLEAALLLEKLVPADNAE